MQLSGKRILSTRPQDADCSWASCLQARGAQVDCIPMLEITPLEGDAAEHSIKPYILDLDRYDAVIFVSRNAVAYGMGWVDRYWPQLPAGQRYYAIGSATAEALQAWDIEARSCDAMNSEALLALEDFHCPHGQRILIMRGRGGRPTLQEVLEARGAQVDLCELYQRTRPASAPAALADYPHNPDAISVHSGETLANLQGTLATLPQGRRDRLMAAPLLVPGNRVAGLARAAGFSRVIEAQNASARWMLEALEGWAAGGE